MVAQAQAMPQPTREDRLIATIERLEHRIEAMEGTIRRLETAATQGPAVIATVTDIFDGLVERLAARGIDVDARMRAFLRATEQLTSPRALDALASMLSSEIMAHQTTEVIGRMGRAIVAAEHEARRVSMWGLWRALRDPDVQRATGFLVAMARRFGEELEALPELTAGGDA